MKIYSRGSRNLPGCPSFVGMLCMLNINFTTILLEIKILQIFYFDNYICILYLINFGILISISEVVDVTLITIRWIEMLQFFPFLVGNSLL